jgi:long-chain acyl-CoA synthetase
MTHTFAVPRAATAATLGDVLRKQSRGRRDATAVVCGEHRSTYAELDGRVDRLASSLRAAGVETGSRVLWLGQNCHRVLELLLACAKTGAMVCPVNWRQSAEELAFVVDDLEPTVVVWQEQAIGEAVRRARELATAKALWLQHDGEGEDSYEAFVAAGAPDDPEVYVDPASPVLIIYTAAFGGRPGGSLLTHQGLLVQGQLLMDLADYTAETVYLNCGPLFHIGTFMFTVTTLLAGGTNVFISKAEAADLCAVIDAERVTHGFVLPATILEILPLNADGRYDLSSLHTMIPIPGWTEITRPDISKWGRKPGGFGQTEVHGMVAYNALGGRAELSTAGTPAPLAQVRVVGPDDVELPRGDVGELVVRGPQVHAGYWNRDELNAERFRGGWWHSHDLGRVADDGVIEFVGPKTQMIKSGVENIYPAEVESCIEAHAAVREAAVIGIPDPAFIQSVKAVVVLNDGASLTLDELVEHCRSRIASYKKPKSLEIVDGLPRTAAGGKDYRALDDRFGGGGYPGGGTRSS